MPFQPCPARAAPGGFHRHSPDSYETPTVCRCRARPWGCVIDESPVLGRGTVSNLFVIGHLEVGKVL